MSIRNFVPELWSAKIETALRKNLVYAGPAVCNRDYEGDIANAGDTVKVTTVGRPTVRDYIPGQPLAAPEQIVTGQRVFQVDQAKSWSFNLDDIDKRQAAMDFMSEAADESAFAVAEGIDRYVAGMHTQVPAGNNIGTITINESNPTSWDVEARKAYDNILVPLGVKLDEQDVPEQGRYVMLPPWLYGVMRRDSRFIEYQKSNNAATLRTGEVGEAAGFAIMKSRNVPETTTNNFVVTAGTAKAITFASQIADVEAYRSQTAFADVMRGLYVYGAKVFRPEFVVKATTVRA